MIPSPWPANHRAAHQSLRAIHDNCLRETRETLVAPKQSRYIGDMALPSNLASASTDRASANTRLSGTSRSCS
jgi:hypothetical protein